MSKEEMDYILKEFEEMLENQNKESEWGRDADISMPNGPYGDEC